MSGRYDYRQAERGGFIALVSVIIIASVMMLAVASMNMTGFYTRYSIFDYEMKERSEGLAEACIDTAMLHIAQDASYSPTNEEVAVSGTNTCTIKSVAVGPGASERTIEVWANSNRAYTYLRVVLEQSDLSIVLWEERPLF